MESKSCEDDCESIERRNTTKGKEEGTWYLCRKSNSKKEHKKVAKYLHRRNREHKKKTMVVDIHDKEMK